MKTGSRLGDDGPMSRSRSYESLRRAALVNSGKLYLGLVTVSDYFAILP